MLDSAVGNYHVRGGRLVALDDLDDAFEAAGVSELDAGFDGLWDRWAQELRAWQPVVIDDPEAPPAGPTALRSNSGDEIETPYTDAEAAEICGRIPPAHSSYSFIRSVLGDLERYGSRLSAGKRFWLHRHAIGQAAREEAAAAAERLRAAAEEAAKYGGEPNNFDATPAGRYEQIVAFMSRGAAAIPTGARVTFENGPLMVSVHSTAKGATRWPGGLLVTGCTGFGDPNVPLARIDAAGWVYFADAGRQRSELHALLDMFEEDPAGLVARYGLSNGRCCFCRIALKDPISLAMGYGPVCSSHYSLPWSKEAMAAKKAIAADDKTPV